MAETIAGHVVRCLTLFRALVNPSGGVVLDLPDPGVLLQMSDEQSRFKVWTGNIGAHRTGMSSLDYRLRDASHIKSQVINLLKDLLQLIEDALAIARGEQTPWDQDELEDGDTAGSDSDDDDGPETELGQIAADMADVVSCLLRLTVTIRNPAPHDRYVEAESTDASHFEPFDVQHVRSKYDNIEPWLADRLGKAISRRRQYLRYRHSHHEKLAHGLNVNEIDGGNALEDQTTASSIPSHLKDGRVASRDLPIQTDDGSDAGMSETSYATSIANANRLTIPPLPKEAYGGPFQCPLCYMIIVVKDRISWKKHVYGDLQPYVCLESDCITPEREYSRRHEWVQHLRKNHWTTYRCGSCGLASSSPAASKSHFETCHPAEQSAAELDALVKLSEQPVDIKQGVRCPLCQVILHSVQQYQRHVGRHQEQLSLFALPSLAADNDWDDGERDSDTDNDRNYIADEEEHFNASDEEQGPSSIADFNKRDANTDGSDSQGMVRNKVPEVEVEPSMPSMSAWAPERGTDIDSDCQPQGFLPGEDSAQYAARMDYEDKMRMQHWAVKAAHMKQYELEQKQRHAEKETQARETMEAKRGALRNEYQAELEALLAQVEEEPEKVKRGAIEKQPDDHTQEDLTRKEHVEAPRMENNLECETSRQRVTESYDRVPGKRASETEAENVKPKNEAEEAGELEERILPIKKHLETEYAKVSADEEKRISQFEESIVNFKAVEEARNGSMDVEREASRPYQDTREDTVAENTHVDNASEENVHWVYDEWKAAEAARRKEELEREVLYKESGDLENEVNLDVRDHREHEERESKNVMEGHRDELEREQEKDLRRRMKEVAAENAIATYTAAKAAREYREYKDMKGENTMGGHWDELEREQEEDLRHKMKVAEAEEAIATFKVAEIEKETLEGQARKMEVHKPVRKELGQTGFNDEEIERILQEQVRRKSDNSNEADDKSVYTRMSLRHIDIGTLEYYKVDFEMDEEPSYVLIKRWVPEWEQDLFWKHTRLRRIGGQKTTMKLSDTSVMYLAEETQGVHDGEYEFVRKNPRRNRSQSGLLAEDWQ